MIIFHLFTLFSILFVVNLAHASDLACSDEKLFKSKKSTIETIIHFENKMNNTMKTYWIDFKGARKFYSKLEPNQKISQRTFLGHYWVVTDLKDKCLSISEGQKYELVLIMKGEDCCNDDDDKLVQNYINQNLYNEALILAKENYESTKKVLGERNLKTISKISILASIYFKVDNIKQSLLLYSKAYTLSKEVLGEDDDKTIFFLSNIASLYYYNNDVNTSLSLHKKIYERHKKILGENNDSTLTSLNNIAGCYLALGKNQDAIDAFKKIYLYRKEYLGDKHPNTLEVLANLAATYNESGFPLEALALNEKSYALHKDVFGEQFPDTLNVAMNLAENYRNLGRFSEALILNEKIYIYKKKIFGEKHSSTLQSANNLAENYRNLGRYTDALVLNEQVYKVRKEILGDKHPDAIQSANNLAENYRNLGRYTDALILNEQAYKVRKETLGNTHPDTLNSANSLAVIYLDLKQFIKALILGEQTYKISKELLEEQHPDVIRNTLNLAVVYLNLKEYEKAIYYFEEGLKNFENIRLNPQLDSLSRIIMLMQSQDYYFKLAASYIEQKDTKKAFATIERSKSRTLLEEMSRKFAMSYSGLTDKEIENWQNLYTAINKLTEIIVQTENLEKRQYLQIEHTRLNQEWAILHQKLEKQYPKYRQLSNIQIVQIEPELLPIDSIFINYFVNSENHILILTLSNTGEITSHDLGKIPNLANTIEAYRKILETGSILKLRTVGLYRTHLKS